MAESQPTTFQSHHGPLLNAAFGGGPAGAIENGIPLGLISARTPAEAPGPDETFTVDDLGDSQIAIRSRSGHYVCAEQGGGSILIANREYSTPGPWEIFTVTIVDDAAGAVALHTHDGRYVTAELDGTVQAVHDYPDGPGPWETWIVSAPWWHVAGGGDGVPGNREAAGAIALDGRICCDENGRFLALGASFFWVGRAWRDYRDRYDANLSWLQQHGFNYYRGFVTVGGWPEPDGWRDAGAFLPWALEVLPLWLDDAFARYRLRCSLTLFDGEVQCPTDGEQDAYVRAVCDILKPRMHTLQDVQIANEYGPTKWDYPQGIARLRRHVQTVRHELGPAIPLSISSRNTCMYDGSPEEVYAECHTLYDGLLPDIVTVTVNHDSRETGNIDGHWRHVRQGWERVVSDPVTGQPLEPDASIDDEPMGPRSSVAAEENPSLIVSKAVNDYISGRHAYTYHADAGIWSNLLNPPQRGMGEFALIEDHPASPLVGQAFQALMPLLPAEMVEWRRTRHGFDDHPFAASFENVGGVFTQIWPDGVTPDHGVVRAYAAVDGLQFVVGLMGIKDRIDLKWTDAMEFEIYACGTGALVQSITSAAGAGALTVPASIDTDCVVIGRYL